MVARCNPSPSEHSREKKETPENEGVSSPLGQARGLWVLSRRAVIEPEMQRGVRSPRAPSFTARTELARSGDSRSSLQSAIRHG